jgi:hypothetical protein
VRLPSGGFRRPGQEGATITTKTYVEKTRVVATLRSRGLHSRADWVEKDLPALIDTKKHASLLGTLGIDADALRSGTEVVAGA